MFLHFERLRYPSKDTCYLLSVHAFPHLVLKVVVASNVLVRIAFLVKNVLPILAVNFVLPKQKLSIYLSHFASK